jgi:hypothetical protein
MSGGGCTGTCSWSGGHATRICARRSTKETSDAEGGGAGGREQYLDFARLSLSAPCSSLEEEASSLGGRTFLRVWRRSGGGDGEAGRTRADVSVCGSGYTRALQK